MRHSYIGVTGIMSGADAAACLAAFDPDCGRVLMLGVLGSSKSLTGRPVGNPRRYPPLSDYSRIFPREKGPFINLIHYHTDYAPSLGLQLRQMSAWGGWEHGFLHGFQINGVWPSPVQVAEGTEPGMRVVLQVGPRAASLFSNGEELDFSIARYCGAITDVLLDASGGEGKPFDITTVRRQIAFLRAGFPALGLGIAGGLCAANLDGYDKLCAEFGPLSCDAEGRLRTEDDNFDAPRAQAYIRTACEIAKLHRRAGDP